MAEKSEYDPMNPGQLILASQSSARAALLKGAGLDFTVEPASIDEDEIKISLRNAGAKSRDAAMSLAELKASRVSLRHGEAYVIGADQILSCGDVWFDKPADLDHAKAHLMSLRGREHVLDSAICVTRGGRVIWRHLEKSRLVMRDFSDAFLEDYLAKVGDAALSSVGAYQLEGRGAQLFAKVEGDYFSILGLPLLALLDFLRNHGLVGK